MNNDSIPLLDDEWRKNLLRTRKNLAVLRRVLSTEVGVGFALVIIGIALAAIRGALVALGGQSASWIDWAVPLCVLVGSGLLAHGILRRVCALWATLRLRSRVRSGELIVLGERYVPARQIRGASRAVLERVQCVWPELTYSMGLVQRDHRARANEAVDRGQAAMLDSRRSAWLKYAQLDMAAGGLARWRIPEILDAKGNSQRLFLKVKMLPGQTVEAWANRGEELAQGVGVHSIRITQPTVMRTRGEIIIDLLITNPLERTITWNSPAPVDWENFTITVGELEDGRPAQLRLREVSGVIFGGIPGAGKSVGAMTMLLPIIASPAAEVHVIDGKAGGDWKWSRGHVKSLIGDDLRQAVRAVEGIHRQMLERLERMGEASTSPNFWHNPISVGHRPILLVVDECQHFFESSGVPKEDRELIERFTRVISALVKKGRSAGIVTILMTQKPTSEALPTRIRDNCSLRVCFRVVTAEAERSVLGTIPDSSTIRATDIPAGTPGVAVIADDQGKLVYARFALTPLSLAEKLLESAPSID